MSARRKNSKALKRLRANGLNIDGNFRVADENLANFEFTFPFEGYQRYFTRDESRKITRIDPMLVRRLYGRIVHR